MTDKAMRLLRKRGGFTLVEMLVVITIIIILLSLFGSLLMYVMDRHLRDNAYLAGDDYTIADMACWPWINLTWNVQFDKPREAFEHLERWFQTVSARPAVRRVDGDERRRPRADNHHALASATV